MGTLSNRMQWPVPGKKQEPWLDAFLDLVKAMDGSAYAAREDRNIIIMGGGFMSWNAGTGVLQWAGTLQFLSSIAGALCQLDPGNVTLLDGQVCYVPLARYPVANITIVPVVANNTPNDDSAVVFCVRRGSQLYFRNGNVLKTGQSGNLIENGGTPNIWTGLYGAPPEQINAGATGAMGVATQPSPGDHIHPVNTATAGDIAALDAGATAAGTSQKLPRADHKHTIATGVPVGTGTANSAGAAAELARRDHVHKTQVVVGHNAVAVGIRPKINFLGATVTDDGMADKVDVKIDPTMIALGMATFTDLDTWTSLGQFTIDPSEWGPGAVFNLLGQGSVTGAGLSGDMQIYNLTDAGQAAIVNYTGMGDLTPSRKLAAFVPPAGAKVYELRVRVTGGGGAGSGDQLKVGWGGIRVSY